jgi:hypothetical protein
MAQPATTGPLPANVSYGTITGRFLTAVADSPDDVDRNPEGLPATDLSIRFTPNLVPAVVRDASATPPTIFALSDVVATVGPTGDLIGPDGAAGVRLVASTGTALDPSGWTWRVTLSSLSFPAMSFSFGLDPGQSVELASVVQVPASPGASLAAWLQAVTDAQAARDAAQAAAAAVPSPAALATTYAPARTAKTGMFVPCSTRANQYNTLSNATFSSGTYRTLHVATTDITELELCYGNFTINSSAVVADGPSTLTVRASVEIPSVSSTRVRGFTATGSRSLTIDPGGTGRLRFPVFIPKGTIWYEWTYVSVTAGGQWPVGLLGNYAANGNTTVPGFDTTLSGQTGTDGEGDNLTGSGGPDITATGAGTISGNYTALYGAYAILGTSSSTSPVVVGSSGDSIIGGGGDFPGVSFMTRALNNQVNHVLLGRPGENANQWPTSTTRDFRNALLRTVTHGISNYGRNDLTGGGTLATIQGNLIKCWLVDTANGSLWGQTTIPPRTTSTDSWATLANQTATSDNAVRLTLNAWLRDGAPMHYSGGTWTADAVGTTGSTIARAAVYDKTNTLVTAASGPAHLLALGIRELADLCESSRDSGKWTVSPQRIVTDGAVDTSNFNNKFLLNSATANFTSADVGKVVLIPGAGASGALHQVTIFGVVSSSQVRITSAASTTVTGASVTIGAYTTDGIHPAAWLHAAATAVVPVAQFV